MNPMQMMKFAGMWKRFVQEHPKFPQFWKAAAARGVLSEGTVMELRITKADGEHMVTNLKLSRADIEMIEELRGIRNS